MFAGTGTSWNVQDAVNAFAYEALGYTYGALQGTEQCNTSDPNIPTCGHYTQLVWDITTQVGCAVKTCSPLKNGNGGNIFDGRRSTLVVCQYSPPGNWVGQTPYDSTDVRFIAPSNPSSPTNGNASAAIPPILLLLD